MSVNIIKQADEIVGITEQIGVLNRHLVSADIFRRGAYFEWLAKQDHDTCVDAYHRNKVGEDRVGSIDVEVLSRVVVEVHAATQPKGDGLPEGLTAVSNIAERPESMRGVIVFKRDGSLTASLTGDEQRKTQEYLDRCLSKPVRRLLAEFDVTDQAPKGDQAAITICDPTSEKFCPPVVCWLVPKAVKP